MDEKHKITIRPFPWPYRAMLAICSDIDMERARHFAALHRFLNTTEMTPLGEGLGLDISDSFWFYAPLTQNPVNAQMSFFSGMDWRTRSPAADLVLDCIRGGWIDTTHAYGNFGDNPPGGPGCFTREHAKRALGVLDEAGLAIRVWSNHGNRNNIQNMARDDYVGDQLGHPCRHSDLLMKFGVGFMWSGYQSTDFRREAAVQPIELRDGQKIWQFSRQDLAYRDDAEDLAARFGAIVRRDRHGPFALVWHPQLLHIQLSPENLAELAENGGYAILGQHLGRTRGGNDILSADAVDAVRRLKAAQDAGDILVAGTARLVEYAVTREGLRFATACDASGKIVIDISGIDDPVRGEQALSLNRLRGITFEVPYDGPVELRLRGALLSDREIAEHRRDGRRAVGIRWFPADHTDYAGDWERRLAGP